MTPQPTTIPIETRTEREWAAIIHYAEARQPGPALKPQPTLFDNEAFALMRRAVREAELEHDRARAEYFEGMAL